MPNDLDRTRWHDEGAPLVWNRRAETVRRRCRSMVRDVRRRVESQQHPRRRPRSPHSREAARNRSARRARRGHGGARPQRRTDSRSWLATTVRRNAQDRKLFPCSPRSHLLLEAKLEVSMRSHTPALLHLAPALQDDRGVADIDRIAEVERVITLGLDPLAAKPRAVRTPRSRTVHTRRISASGSAQRHRCCLEAALSSSGTSASRDRPNVIDLPRASGRLRTPSGPNDEAQRIAALAFRGIGNGLVVERSRRNRGIIGVTRHEPTRSAPDGNDRARLAQHAPNPLAARRRGANRIETTPVGPRAARAHTADTSWRVTCRASSDGPVRPAARSKKACEIDTLGPRQRSFAWRAARQATVRRRTATRSRV